MSKGNILIVEDDAIIQFKLKHTVDSLGHSVVGAADTGEKAIATAIETQPDLVLMDIRLKGSMDGIQAAEKIREQLDAPIIFMTAYSDENKIKRAKKTLPYGYLLKPVQDKELEINIEIALYIARIEAEKRVADEEKKKLQQQLFQAQKMESLGTLAGGIAHDFNNLLFQIMGSIQIAKKRLPDEDRSIKNLSNALQAAFRAKDLVQQILTFSRKTKSEHHPSQIQPILKQALKLLRSSLPTTIEIQQKINPDAGSIRCDPTQIYQVLMNLCTNASHAIGDETGIITVTLVEKKESSTLELIVEDTGKGMDRNVIDKIFEPYFTTKETGEGTGLGLSIVHGIVNNHNGNITVTSEPGKGSKFTVSFPLITPVIINRESSLPLNDLPQGDEHILVIDDEELIMKMEAEILESLGYKITGFSSAEDALEAYEKNPDSFDLILTDQTMPKMTGYELSEKILKMNPDTRIILLTGFSESLSEEEVLACGIKRYLLKPIDMYKLAVTVRETLDE